MGLLLIWSVIWWMGGVEVIGVDQRRLRYTVSVFGLDWTDVFVLEGIDQLRLHREISRLGYYFRLAFEYGGRTIKLGALEKEQAQEILGKIRNECPGICAPEGTVSQHGDEVYQPLTILKL
ncbi:MAG: hypothetical protein GC160_06740 [Acidobacteria bacterium]|nr:hypothetical protein [Acidobacteriota bacterium]